jgi:hypothetical protein
MKSRILEKGSSAHIVIIIVLVVALLGALGFVFWQNFVNKPATTSTTDSLVLADNTDSENNNIAISEWGVSGSYTKTNESLVQYILDTSNGYDYVYFDTTNVPDDCKSYGGTIKRFGKTDDVVYNSGSTGSTAVQIYDENGGDTDKFKKIGDMYYLYEGPQSVCRMDNEDPGQIAAGDIVGVTKDFMASIKAE